MKYIAEYEHIFFDRYDMNKQEKEKCATYLIEKVLDEEEILFSRTENMFVVDEYNYEKEIAFEEAKEILNHEFFIFMEPQGEEKSPGRKPIENYVLKMYVYESFSANSLAEHFHMSRKKLEKYFEESFSVSVKEYIRNVRVMKAKGHIQKGERMEKVAYITGFGSVKTMTRAFKVSCNATPGQFRPHLTEKL